MALLESLQWRYATKKMNREAVPQDKVESIIEAAYLAPTSNGLQPFSIIAISNKELKEKIRPIAHDQSQITDSSHLLVFAAWDNYTEERIAQIIDHTTSERGLPKEATEEYKGYLISTYTARTPDTNFNHTARQAYLGFGVAIAAAAELKVDATPMEGFDNQALDELLELPKKGLKSVTILALGYRDVENDWLVNLKKVRTPKSEFLIEVL
ncbi:MAG: nitroreductase family protein [Prevotella sp.]|jgi:nitroreductase|nr:nitroreductase family protein [Prevotella sp.]